MSAYRPRQQRCGRCAYKPNPHTKDTCENRGSTHWVSARQGRGLTERDIVSEKENDDERAGRFDIIPPMLLSRRKDSPFSVWPKQAGRQVGKQAGMHTPVAISALDALEPDDLGVGDRLLGPSSLWSIKH